MNTKRFFGLIMTLICMLLIGACTQQPETGSATLGSGASSAPSQYTSTPLAQQTVDDNDSEIVDENDPMGTTESEASLVESINPSDNENYANVNDEIIVTFSHPMDENTINEYSFLVKDEDGEVIDGAIAGSGTVFTFTPDDALQSDSLYTVVITTDAQDDSGHALGELYSSSFRTQRMENSG